MGFIFWRASSFEGLNGGYPPPLKNSKFFGQIFSQRIDRKSQKISVTFAWPFGRDKGSKKSVGPPGRKG